MSDTQHSPDLSALTNDYEIVGQIGGSGDARSYLARRKGGEGHKRRDDQMGVVITVVSPPAGDEGNALSHLAADTQALAHTAHRRLVPVLEGRWIGNDAFAVVTQRITDPSLADRLASGESFTTPRIAAILREVNALLEWARDQKIVHRRITPFRIFLEPKTDRVRVSFDIAPIQRLHQIDADDDARTIARLAVAMLSGAREPESYDEKALAGLRSGLPEQFVDSTAALLDEKRSGKATDVASYLALIGMADPLHAGESERDRIRAEILEEQRLEREKLANERAEFERKMASERAIFERTMTEERASFAKKMELERDRLAKDRAELERAVAKERGELQRALFAERAALVTRRAELERVVSEQRAELERVAAKDRREIDALRASLQRAGELEIEKKRLAALEEITGDESTLDEGKLATPRFVPPMVVPLEQLRFDDDTPVMSREPVVFAPASEREVPTEAGAPKVTSGDAPNRRKWLVPGAVAAAAIIGVSAVMLGNRHPEAQPVVKPVPATVVAHAPVAAIVAPPVAVPAPSDSAQVNANPVSTTVPRVDSLASRAPRPVDSARVLARAAAARRAARAARDSAARDSAAQVGPRTLTDSLFDFRTPVRARRDTNVKRDTIARPDTTGR
jgi:hypothetical protein